ncbi:MAG: hypothetical protein ACPGVE_03745 [Flavobacteriales bacterium]
MIVTLLISCKSDDDSSSASLVGEWMAVDAELNGISYWDNSVTCSNDDITIFRSNNTYEANEGATKCDPNDDQIISTGTWNWITEGSQLEVNGSSFDVQKLTGNDLIIVSTSFEDEIKTYFKRQ